MTDSGRAAQRILFVCTGNVCRSPYMEYALRGMLDARGAASDVQVHSAGTRALSGHPLAEPLARRLHDRGVDPAAFRAAELDRAHIDEAAVVLTATRDHRRQVVRLAPDATERTFTLAQFARLLRVGDPGGRLDVDGLVAAAHAAHGRGPVGGDDDDLEDPWRRSRRTYRRVADRIDGLLGPIVARLAGEA